MFDWSFEFKSEMSNWWPAGHNWHVPKIYFSYLLKHFCFYSTCQSIPDSWNMKRFSTFQVFLWIVRSCIIIKPCRFFSYLLSMHVCIKKIRIVKTVIFIERKSNIVILMKLGLQFRTMGMGLHNSSQFFVWSLTVGGWNHVNNPYKTTQKTSLRFSL